MRQWLVAQVEGSRGLQYANQVEFDALGREVVEEPPALAEENWPELISIASRTPAFLIYMSLAAEIAPSSGGVVHVAANRVE